jgi:uncharacterized protein YhfF
MGGTIRRYWEQFLASLPPGADRPGGYVESASFGFTPEDASQIAELVVRGTKTATGSVLWSYEADGKPVPRVGDHWVVVDGQQDPVCVIRTTEVRILPFDEVPESYAWAGGEGDRTLSSWRDMYWRYIVSECKRIGREPGVKAPLVMERFEVVYHAPIRES